jgi:hypothetical protein
MEFIMPRELCPYILKDGTHLLSKFGERTTTVGKIAELRVSLNGWTAQRLLHNYTNHADVVPSDLVEYAVDKNVVPDSQAVARLSGSIVNSDKLKALYNFNTDSWSLATSTKVRNLVPELTALGDRLDAMHGNASLSVSYNLGYNGDPEAPVSHSKSLIFNWDGQPGMSRDAMRAAIDQSFPNLNRRLSDSAVDRVRDPLNWFKTFLIDGGIPMNEFVYAGLSQRVARYYNDGGLVDSIQSRLSTPGATVIVGPRDLHSVGRYPVFVGPYIGVDVVLFHASDMTWANYSSTWGLASPCWAQMESSSIGGSGGSFCVEGTDTSAWPNFPQPVNARGGNPFTTTTLTAGVTKFYYGLASGPEKFALPPPERDLSFFTDYTPCVDSNGRTMIDCMSSNEWYISAPLGLLDMDFGPGAVTQFGTQGSNYTVDGFTIQPLYLGVRTTFAAIRDYLQVLKDDPATTVADKATYTTLLEDSQTYADAQVSTKIYATGVTPPSFNDVDNLRVVLSARSAEEELLDEDLGDGKTFRKAGRILDKARSDGEKYHSYSHILDDVIAPEDMVSAVVLPTLSDPDIWLLDAQLEVDDSLTLIGYIGDSVSPIVLTPTDVGVLYAYGATLGPNLTEDILANEFALGATFIEDVRSMDPKAFAVNSNAVAEGQYTTPDTLFSPSAMLDASGYPVVHYGDIDARTRATLMYKGFGDPVTSIVLTMVFVNNIDWT